VNERLREMVEMSRTVGRNPRWVQGGGGNTSVKTPDGRRMYVKASGTGLGDMEAGRGYRLVDVGKCVAVGRDEALAELPAAEREARVLAELLDSCVDDLEGRPSVETSLHAMLDDYVVHTHPSVVNALLCAVGGRAALERLFADMQPPCLYIEYAGAGYSLARRMDAALEGYRRDHGRLPEIVFLENHGLFVNTGSAARALELTALVFDRIQAAADEAVAAAGLPSFTRPDPEWERKVVAAVTAALQTFYAGVFDQHVPVRFERDANVENFLRLPEARELTLVSPLMPDQVVYCRDHPVWIELPEAPDAAGPAVAAAMAEAAAGVDTPLCVLVSGVGLFCAGLSEKLLEAVSATMKAVLEALSIAVRFGGARGLSDEALTFLRNWEVERFRRTLATGTGRTKAGGGQG
jgi:rhamnose utilization protein RhaD (predicted bifunctional aldolase and dehydrogenase)